MPFGARFFFRCAPPLSLALAGSRPRVPWALVLWVFPLWAFRFSALRALSLLLCVRPGRWLLSGGCCPLPVPFLARCFRRSVLRFLFFFSLFPSFVVSAPAVSGFLWFPAPGALGLGAVCFFFWWPRTSRLAVRSRLLCVFRLALGCSLVVPVPPPLCVTRFSSRPPGPGVFFSFLFFFARPRVSSFLWFPAPGALGLGAVCCLFCWPPASRLAVRSRLFCVSRLDVGCSLVVAPSPPSPFVSRGFRRCLSVLGFFFRCAPPLSQAFSGFRPRMPWALALCVVCFPRGRLWRPVFYFVRRRLVWCCGLWCVLCCASCCVACLCLVGFLRRVAVGLVVLFLLCFAVVRCCVLCWFFFSWSLAFPWCSVLFWLLCFACALWCLGACGVALRALLSCPCCAGWCFVLLSVVFACLLLGLAVLCCLLLAVGPGVVFR